METYIRYLDQVLGIRSVMWPQAQPLESVSVASENSSTIRVLFVAENVWSPQALELFQKMREAMKVEESECRILFATQTSIPELQISALAAQRVVCFSERLKAQLQIPENVKHLTHDPEELLRQPQLKKETWEVLKKVMRSLGLLT